MSPPAELKYFIVDAFTSVPFAGNPAAVVPLEAWPADAWLQNLAREMNLSETAFIVPISTGYELRWFTPTVEVDLCGHATLATAKILAHLEQLTDGGEVSFSTRSGILKTARFGEELQLDFPSQPATSTSAPPDLSPSLGITPLYVGFNGSDYLVEVESEQQVRSLTPDFKKLAQVPCRGVIVTARSSDPQFDFVSRCFAPRAGIDEDPVTGSAHCCLGPYWGEKIQKQSLTGHQVSSRGGIVHVTRVQDRILLRGSAVIVASGTFTPPILSAFSRS